MTAGLKQRDFKPCAVCGKGVMHNGAPNFYRVTIKMFVVDVRAVQRQHGLEQMMGAAAPLAQIMGPDEDLAHLFGDQPPRLVCHTCFLTAHLAQLVGDDEDDEGLPPSGEER